MIDTTAIRRTTLNGKTYEKGDTASMPAGQFEELKPIGRFERAATEKQPAVVPLGKATETKPTGEAA